MTPDEIIQQLNKTGFTITLGESDGTIRVSSHEGKTLTDEQKRLIRENKDKIIVHLQLQDWNPKVVKGAIHYIAHRSQRWINRLPGEKWSTLTDLLCPLRNRVWNAYTSRNPYLVKKALREYYRGVKNFVLTVESDQKTLIP
jgi:hypothetical protein